MQPARPRPDRSLWGETLLLGGAVTAALVLLGQAGRWQIGWRWRGRVPTGIWVLAGFTAAALAALLFARFANTRPGTQSSSDRPRGLESEGPRPVQ